MPDRAVRIVPGGLRVRLHVTPRAGAERVGGFAGDPAGGHRLKVAVCAPAHEGKANAAVIGLLAREWRLPKSALSLVSGAAGRDKVIAIRGDAAVLASRLAAWSAGRPPGEGQAAARSRTRR